MDDGLKIRGIKYLNVETGLLFPPLSKFLATCMFLTVDSCNCVVDQ